jgi:phospholipase/carboxylesterase
MAVALAALLLLAPRPCGAAEPDKEAPKVETGLLQRQLMGPPKLDYWLYVPATYSPVNRYSLVVVLHPAGLKGNHHCRQWGVLAERAGGFIVLAPECADPKKRLWQMSDEPRVLALVRRVMLEYNVDPGRVLLTGFSLGGNYAYKFGLRNPGLFRAIAPFSGVLLARPGGEADAILQRGRGVAVYIVHGAQDDRVPVELARASRDRLDKFGYQLVYQELPVVGHEFAVQEVPRVLRWFQTLPAASPGPEPPPAKGKEEPPAPKGKDEAAPAPKAKE